MRSRNIKPSLFKNEILGVADPILTVVFAGLWCAADREGRIEDRPLRLKAEILPYRENIDFNVYLTELERLEFICRYTVENISVIQVINFKKHQNPHKTEKASGLPKMPLKSDGCKITVKEPLNNGSRPADSLFLIPDSLIPDNEEETPAPQKSKRFTPPSINEIIDYCNERQNEVDAEKWLDYYTSNGWMVGKNKMKCWKAAIRTWEKNKFSSQKNGGFKSKQQINDEIQDIGAALNAKTRFSPYATTETGDSCGDANQGIRSLPE
jgi:hypothetical protein